MLSKTIALIQQTTWILLVGFLTTACNNQCKDADAEQTPSIRFYIVDPQGLPLIKKVNTTYHPDSVRLLSQGDSLMLSVNYDNSLDSYVFETWDFRSRIQGTDLQLLLKLDQSQKDTLNVTYQLNQGRCFSYLEPATFFFNQERVYPDLSKNHLLKLVKQPK